MRPVCRNIHNDQLYFYNGDDEFENIITGLKGVVGEERANRVFKINIEATVIINEYPEVEKMIRLLNLKADVCGLSK